MTTSRSRERNPWETKEAKRVLPWAKRVLAWRKGPPTEADRPPSSTLPGRPVRVLPGQLDLDGNEHDGWRPGD